MCKATRDWVVIYCCILNLEVEARPIGRQLQDTAEFLHSMRLRDQTSSSGAWHLQIEWLASEYAGFQITNIVSYQLLIQKHLICEEAIRLSSQ